MKIKCIGQFTFLDSKYDKEIADMLQSNGYVLEPLYVDGHITSYRVYEAIEYREKATTEEHSNGNVAQDR